MDTAETISNSNIGKNCNCPRVSLRRSYLMKKPKLLNLVTLSLYPAGGL